MKVIVWCFSFVILSGWGYSQTYEQYFALTEKHYSTFPDSCIYYGEKALKLTTDKREQANAQYYIAASYKKQNNLAQAATYYLKTLALFRELKDDKKISNVMLDLGIIFRKGYAFQKAINIYQDAAKIKKRIGDNQLLAGAYRNIAMSYRLLGKYDSAMRYNNMALKLYMSSGNDSRVSRVLNEIGRIYTDRGNYDLAIDHYFQSLEADRNNSRKAKTYNNVGYTYLQMEKPKQAKDYLLKSFELKDGKELHYVANNLARVYLKEQNADSALYYLAMVKDYPVSEEMIYTTQLLADAYEIMGDHDSRNQLLDRSIELNVELMQINESNERRYAFYQLESALYKYQRDKRDERIYWFNFSLAGLGLLVVILAFIQLRKYLATKKAKASIISDLENLK